MISGRNQDQNGVVIVELKQWEAIEKVTGKEAIVKTVMRNGLVETTHPSYQAWSYAALIKDYNENAQNDQIELYPCAYLHNYIENEERDSITDEIYDYYV